MGKEFIPGIQLPPGFRFHPSDEELIVHYLRNKATSNPLPASIIREVDLYKCNPWDLKRNALLGDEEWYFFTPRDRKYPKGVRPNRMAGSGYWKATGSDKPILSSCGEKTLGVKKGLVFYKGRPPKGVKTNWIMHEYRIPEATVLPTRQKGCMRLDDWVLCRVRQKSTVQKNMWEDGCVTDNNPSRDSKKGDEPCYINTYDNLAMVKKNFHRECLVPPILFAPQGLPLLDRVSNLRFEASKTSTLNLKDKYETNYTQYEVHPFDSLVIGKKRKHREGNWEESFSQLKKLKDRDDKWNDITKELNPCSVDHSEGSNSNASQWSCISQYQELHHLVFTESDWGI